MQSVGYPNSPSGSLSARLRDETADVHEAAERSGFMTRLLDGGLPVAAYVQLIGQYLPIYRSLEAAGDRLGDDPVAGPFARAQLARCHALETDLVSLAGTDWAANVRVTEATDEYAARIDAACSEWSGLFVAHHYVRYLGDLSGGQIIRRILRRTYDLADDRGLSFYVFDDIDNGVQFKKQYRTQLDATGLDTAECDRIVAEARRAFQLNLAVFDSLETDWNTAVPTSSGS